MMQYWIFRTSPTNYDIRLRLLAESPLLTWKVSQHRARIQPGDLAFIWIGGPLDSQAVLGAVRVEDPPAVMEVPREDVAFWSEPPAGPEYRVPCRIIARGPEVQRESIADLAEMQGHTILFQHQHLNHALSVAQGQGIAGLMGIEQNL